MPEVQPSDQKPIEQSPLAGIDSSKEPVQLPSKYPQGKSLINHLIDKINHIRGEQKESHLKATIPHDKLHAPGFSEEKQTKNFGQFAKEILGKINVFKKLYRFISHRAFKKSNYVFKIPLSDEDLRTLADFGTFLDKLKNNDDLELNPEEKKDFATLFVRAAGNESIYRQLELMDEKELEKWGIGKNLASFFKSFSASTKGIQEAGHIVEQAERLIQKSHKHEIIADHEKLSLRELGILDSLMYAQEAVDLIHSLELPQVNEQLAGFMRIHKKASLIHSQIEFKLNKYSIHQAGDLLVEDKEKRKKMKGEEAEGIPSLAICFKEKGNSKTSDKMMGPEGKPEDLNLEQKASINGYRIDPFSLLNKNPALTSVLESIDFFGKGEEDISGEIRKKYQTILNKILSEDSKYISQVENRLKERQWPALSEIFSRHAEGTMGDAEFAALTSMIGLIELEYQLKNEINDFNRTIIGMPFDQVDSYFTDKQIETLFNLPFSPDKDDLVKLSIQDFLKRLADRHCLERLTPPPLLQDLVKAKDLHINDQRKSSLSVPLISARIKEREEPKLVPSETKSLVELPKNPSLFDKLCSWEKIGEEGAINVLSLFEKKLEVLKTEKDPEKDIFAHIKARREEIKSEKNRWKEKIKNEPPETLSFQFRQEVLKIHEEGELTSLGKGMGGALVLKKDDIPYAIVKVPDADLLSLNHPFLGSPFSGIDPGDRIRANIPTYQKGDILAYEVAEVLGLTDITPLSAAVVLKDDKFPDIMDNVSELNDPNTREDILRRVGGEPDRERVCFVQAFIHDSVDLLNFNNEMTKKQEEEDWSEEQYENSFEQIDPEDVFKVFIFCCVIGETDGNVGNFRIINKGVDKFSQPVKGLRKIDNTLGFPDNNKLFSTCFAALPHMNRNLSPEEKQFIHNINTEAVINKMIAHGKSENAINACRERIGWLKEFAGVKKLTLDEINAKFDKNAPKKKVGKVEAEKNIARADILGQSFGTSPAYEEDEQNEFEGGSSR